jgi:hypothetical protein
LIQYPVNGDGESYIPPSSTTSIADRAFEGNRNLTSVEFGDSLISIGNRSFLNNESLVSVRFGKNVNSIGNQAFYTTVGSLFSAIFLGNAPASFGSAVFQGVPEDFKVFILSGKTGFTPGNGTWTPTVGQSYPLQLLTSENNFLFTTSNATAAGGEAASYA